MQPNSCPSCQYKLLLDWYFCPNCGKQLKDKVPVITIPKQLLIYLVSFFLAPLGLGWGFKYVRSKDTKVRVIGIITILLTVIAIASMFVLFQSVADQYMKILNELSGPGFL